MPATTTAINGCDAVIKIDDSGGTLRDVSGSSNSFNLDLSNDIGEFKPFGSKWKIRLACGKDAKLSIKFAYSLASNEALQILRDWQFAASMTPRTIRLDVPDSSIGGDRYEGEYLLSTMSIPGDAGEADPIMVSAEFLPTGAVTYSAISS